MTMKRLLAIAMIVGAAVIAPAPVSAKPPTEVTFVENYTVDPAALEVRTAGPNTFLSGSTATDVWSGDVSGTATQEFVVVNHSVAGFNFYTGRVEFTGTVLGREGTMVMKVNGKQASESALPSDAMWAGHWVIIGGTGDLAKLHGQGTLSGPSLTLTFEGDVHFSK